MSRPLIRIHDAKLNEIVDREMNAAEFAEWQQLQTEETERRSAVEATIVARASARAKLAALGLTDAEIAALLP
jgi:hypothetical protein